MRPHRKLDVWKKSVDLVVKVYKATESFPNDERFGLTSQVKPAAVSIPANIAEGAGRNSDKEFLHFLSISQGSASEVETELIIANRLEYIDSNICNDLIDDLDNSGRMITGLSNHLRNKL